MINTMRVVTMTSRRDFAFTGPDARALVAA